MSDLLRVYLDPGEIGRDGYPYAWHGLFPASRDGLIQSDDPAIKDLVRDLAGHRCIRCGHPYQKGQHGRGEWSPCDESCAHSGPLRVAQIYANGAKQHDWFFAPGPNMADGDVGNWMTGAFAVEAQWRILTVHHLNGVKNDCRWWNLTALCQRCHLTIQGRVVMERPFHGEHSDWFKPYVGGFYAWSFLGEDLDRVQVMARLDELLGLEDRQMRLV